VRVSSLGSRLLAGLGALVLFALTALSVTVVTDDYVHRETLPAGASVNGTDLSGLPRAEAHELIEERVAEPLTSPVSVRYGDKTFELDVSGVLTVDVDGSAQRGVRSQAGLLPS